MSVYIERARRQGPCLMCGNGDNLASARHRLWDAVDDGLRIDRMTPEECADNWSIDVDEVRWVGEAFRRARSRHRVLPGRDVFA